MLQQQQHTHKKRLFFHQNASDTWYKSNITHRTWIQLKISNYIWLFKQFTRQRNSIHTHTRHCDVISLDWFFTIIYICIYSRRPSIVRKAFSFSDKRQSKRLIISIHMTWGYLNVKCHKHPYTHTRCDCESSNESALSGRFFFGERLTPG